MMLMSSERGDNITIEGPFRCSDCDFETYSVQEMLHHHQEEHDG